jgi:ergothioneine biosynthesis protein EgtB
MLTLLADPSSEVARVTTIGLHHEQQHQELMITDLKHALCTSPMAPAVWPAAAYPNAAPSAGWLTVAEGFGVIGHTGDGFCFDNECPSHQAWTPAFALGRDLVTSGDWLAFMADGGYGQVGLWMSDGCAARELGGWQAPLYWTQRDGAWFEATLAGERPVALHAPVTHVSWFEADAFARWAGARLPTEFEWDRAVAAAGGAPGASSFCDHQPDGAAATGSLAHLFGQVWQWTGSAYRPYPGYQPLPGTLGEYNGKFMHGQLVLRGSSCATPPGHARCSYRNFFPADTRWQFSGVRLAKDL